MTFPGKNVVRLTNADQNGKISAYPALPTISPMKATALIRLPAPIL